MALEEICARDGGLQDARMEIVLVVAKILLHKSLQGGSIPKHRLVQVSQHFPSVEGAEMAAIARSRRSRRSTDDIAHRTEGTDFGFDGEDLVWPSSVGRCGSSTRHGRHVECSDRQGSPTRSTGEGVVTGDNGVHAGGAIELG